MFSAKKQIVFDRSKVIKMLQDKEYKEIRDLFIIFYKGQTDESLKDNMHILLNILHILENPTKNSDKNLTFIIDRWNTLEQRNKKNASNDIIELLFNMLFSHQAYDKIIEYSIFLIREMEDLDHSKNEEIYLDLLSELYTLQVKAYKTLSKAELAKEAIKKSLSIGERKKHITNTSADEKKISCFYTKTTDFNELSV